MKTKEEIQLESSNYCQKLKDILQTMSAMGTLSHSGEQNDPKEDLTILRKEIQQRIPEYQLLCQKIDQVLAQTEKKQSEKE